MLAILLRKSPVACSVLGAWLALLLASWLPLWTTNRNVGPPVRWVPGDFWDVLKDLRSAIHYRRNAVHGRRAEVVLQHQWGNLLVTCPVLALGAVAGLLLHRLYRKRREARAAARSSSGAPVGKVTEA
jgi:hypothetical protein